MHFHDRELIAPPNLPIKDKEDHSL